MPSLTTKAAGVFAIFFPILLSYDLPIVSAATTASQILPFSRTAYLKLLESPNIKSAFLDLSSAFENLSDVHRTNSLRDNVKSAREGFKQVLQTITYDPSKEPLKTPRKMSYDKELDYLAGKRNSRIEGAVSRLSDIINRINDLEYMDAYLPDMFWENYQEYDEERMKRYGLGNKLYDELVMLRSGILDVHTDEEHANMLKHIQRATKKLRDKEMTNFMKKQVWSENVSDGWMLDKERKKYLQRVFEVLQMILTKSSERVALDKAGLNNGRPFGNLASWLFSPQINEMTGAIGVDGIYLPELREKAIDPLESIISKSIEQFIPLIEDFATRYTLRDRDQKLWATAVQKLEKLLEILLAYSSGLEMVDEGLSKLEKKLNLAWKELGEQPKSAEFDRIDIFKQLPEKKGLIEGPDEGTTVEEIPVEDIIIEELTKQDPSSDKGLPASFNTLSDMLRRPMKKKTLPKSLAD